MAEKVQYSHIQMNGLKVKGLAAATANGEAVRYDEFTSGSTADRNRANHTGTQLAATISDFDTAVRLSRLDQMAAPTASVSFNAQKITNLANGAAASQDAATVAQVEAASTADRNRANHTGTQVSATISDFTVSVQAIQWRSMATPTSQVSLGGQKIVNLAAGTGTGDAVRWDEFSTGSTADRNRANHTGTQLAATISDFNTAVRTNRLDQMATPLANVDMGSVRITNLADPNTAQGAATKNYVDTMLAGVTASQVLKGQVVAAELVNNVNIAAPGTTIDGVAMTAGDRVILGAQTTPANNGAYIWNGSAVAMTRDPTWDTSAEMTLGSYWVVLKGTYADGFILFTNDAAPTVGTTALAFASFGTNNGVRKFLTSFGAVAAGATLVFTHNLGTRTPTVQVFDSSYNAIDLAWDGTSLSTVTIRPDAAITSGFIAIQG